MYFRGCSVVSAAVVLVAIVLVVALSERYLFRGRFGGQSVDPTQEAVRRKELEESKREFARGEQREAVRLSDEILASVDASLAEIELWKKDVEPLRTSFDGRMIAGSEPLTEQIFFLFEEHRPSADELAKVRERTKVLVEPIRAAYGRSEDVRPATDVMDELKSLHQTATESQTAWSNAVTQATAIRREAMRGTHESSDENLDKHLERMRDREAIAELRIRRAREEKAAEEARMLKEAEAAESARLAKAKEELRKKATAPEVQTVLAPLVARRALQPVRSGASIRFRRTAEERPMSLSWLESVGALEPTLDGLSMLAHIGADRDLPEPRWPFQTTPDNWSEANQDFLRRAQKMLNDYGQILVEEGMLSP